MRFLTLKPDLADKGEKILQSLERKYKIGFDQLMEAIKSYNSNFDEHKFKQAFLFAAAAHDGQLRKQEGVPYIIHPFETAKILAQIHADETTLIASLLHDVPEDTQYTLEEVEQYFGKQVSYLVEGITKLSKVHYLNNMQQREVESLQKLFIHVGEDPRTMLIKLADRLHNMRTLEYMDVPEKRYRKARETLEIFSPIASLLGITAIQNELEDLCFQNLYPDDFIELREKVATEQKKHKKIVEIMVEDVEVRLKEHKIDAIVYPRQSHLYYIYKRLKHQNKQIQDYDIGFSINIIGNDIPSCYKILGHVHSIYKPKPGMFKDYISLPKVNGYQSLHTTVFGNHGILTKFAIRTNQMHYEAQYGIAASYFDSKGKHKKNILAHDSRASWVEEAIRMQRESHRESRYIEDIKKYVLLDRITVLTPKGKIIELPANSSCIDFAYHIHTEVGNRALRAKVNEQFVPLNFQLKRGDVVDILTTEYPKAPSYEWLNFAKTPLAQKRMRDYFKKESASSKVQTGRKMLQKEYDRAGLGLVNDLAKWKIKKVSQYFTDLKINSLDDILINIAEGNIYPVELINLLYPSDSLNIDNLTQAGIKLPFILSKLIKFRVKVICDPSTNLIKIVETVQKRKDTVLMTAAETKYNFISKQIYIYSTMYVKSYTDISSICREIEQIEGVNEVQRVFLTRKIIFLIGSVITFMFWAVHPFLLYYVTAQLEAPSEQIKLLTNITLISGLLVLFTLIFFLQKYTAKRFPEYRDTNRLWQVAYILSFFAIITIFLEIYLYRLSFDWLMVFGSLALLFLYLTGQYIYFKERPDSHH